MSAWLTSPSGQLAIAAIGVALLIVLVVRWKVHAFLALLLVSVAVGLSAGMPAGKLLETLHTGMGSTLAGIAVIVGLGAILGQLLEAAGGVERLARGLLAGLGSRRAHWALGATGLIVAIPVFFDVALVILAPLALGLAQRAGRPLVVLALPLLAGLAVGHAFIPPTPGPVATAQLLGAPLSWVIVIGIIAGIPATVLAGPCYAAWLTRREPVCPVPPTTAPAEGEAVLPGLLRVAGLIVLPLVLIVGNTVAGQLLPEGGLRTALQFIGNPMFALLLTVFAAAYAFPVLRTPGKVMALANRALEPAGLVILVTGAGGVFKQVLVDSGIGKQLATVLTGAHLPVIVLAFLIAALIRIAQGSATVAMVTAGGIIAPLLDGTGLSSAQLACVVVAIAAGATVCSHVNDSGFWLVGRLFGWDERQTLRTWTVATTIAGLSGFAMAALLSVIV